MAALGTIVLLTIAVPAISAYLELTHSNVSSSALRTGLALVFLLMLSALSVPVLHALGGLYGDDGDDWRQRDDDVPPGPDDGSGFDWPAFQAQFGAYARERQLTPAGR